MRRLPTNGAAPREPVTRREASRRAVRGTGGSRQKDRSPPRRHRFPCPGERPKVASFSPPRDRRRTGHRPGPPTRRPGVAAFLGAGPLGRSSTPQRGAAQRNGAEDGSGKPFLVRAAAGQRQPYRVSGREGRPSGSVRRKESSTTEGRQRSGPREDTPGRPRLHHPNPKPDHPPIKRQLAAESFAEPKTHRETP